MAIVTLYSRQSDSADYDRQVIECESVIAWLAENILPGENFAVYKGAMCEENDISRDVDAVESANEVSVVLLPAGAIGAAIAISLIVAVAAQALVPKPKPLENLDRAQESPNNSLSDRRNKARPNQRIVDMCGNGKSIPDVIQAEFARYNDNIEERIGYYCFCRNQALVENVRDGESLIADNIGSAAGIYYPDKSPNNSSPDIQIGDPINEPVVGVYQSSDAIGQTLLGPNESSQLIAVGLTIDSSGYIEDLSGASDFTELFTAGDGCDLIDIRTFLDFGAGGVQPALVGQNTSKVISVTSTRITFDITGDSTWGMIDGGTNVTLSGGTPRIIRISNQTAGPVRITSIKVDRVLVNVYAPSGLYRNASSRGTSVNYTVYYQKLDDNLNPVGPLTPVSETISGRDSNEYGVTTDIDLGALTYVEISLARTTNKDLSGNTIDDIKLKDVFGLYTIDKDHFGNVTTIQTKRSAVAQATAIREPEVNAELTELVYKYENGSFDTALTPNTQGMQSLIRLALDPYVGRRQESELDLDLLVQTQSDVETYFQSDLAGQFNYSFDSTNTSAQETFFAISNAIFCITWREGRVLKAMLEAPQSVPDLVFTHRSKQPRNETWERQFADAKRKDSIEFVYTDSDTYTKETLYFPTDRSGTNPLKLEITGIKGTDQATWRMMREYNKLLYQEESVSVTTTIEGRLVKPMKAISVVKGTRVATYDGYIRAQNGLDLELSQDVVFTAGDDHYIVLKRRDGSTESIPVTEGASPRLVSMAFLPIEEIYTGNDELKTEFSFGNEARLLGQLMLPTEINPVDNSYVKIKAINYSDLYYKDDPEQPATRAFSDGFSDGFA